MYGVQRCLACHKIASNIKKNIFGATSLKVSWKTDIKLSLIVEHKHEFSGISIFFFSLPRNISKASTKKPGELSRARRSNEQKGRTGDWREVIRIIRAAVVHATRTNLHFK